MITNALVQARQLYEDTDGVLVCDKYGYVEYLKWFHEGFLSDEAIGMHVTEVYPELDNQTSSIMRVIESGVPRFDERQVIHNCKGELLDIVSSTIPLLAGSEVVGAMTSTIFYDKYRAGKGLPKRRQGELYTLDDIISQDPIMIALKERCALIANNDSPVLLYGETGTGKELFAQSLHTCSHRAKSLLSPRTARRSRNRFWKVSSSAWKKAASQERKTEKGCLNWQTAELCFSMRSIPWIFPCRPSF